MGSKRQLWTSFQLRTVTPKDFSVACLILVSFEEQLKTVYLGALKGNQGALDGGLNIPHSHNRLAGFKKHVDGEIHCAMVTMLLST